MVYTFTDKGSTHSYIDYYENHFAPKRNHVRLLEIGIMTGGSLLLWKEFFNSYKLAGIDQNASWSCSLPFQQLLENNTDINLFFGIDSTTNTVPAELIGERFDFIIDDGNHSLYSQLRTFNHYWPLLDVGGAYFIEDVNSQISVDALINHVHTNISVDIKFDHYKGFKENRFDDQIVTFYKL
jgi:hypothetical protein